MLTIGAEPQEWISAEAAAAWDSLGGVRLVVAELGKPAFSGLIAETNTLLHDWMARWGCRALLVRPDKYVYGCATDACSLNKHILDIYGAVCQLDMRTQR